MRRAAYLAAVLGLLAGCSWSPKMSELGGRIAPDTVSLADRCAEFMLKAMPFAEIETGDRTSAGADIRTVVAKVTATRTDAAASALADHGLAVECTFTDNVLTGFRWTKGGPPTQ